MHRVQLPKATKAQAKTGRGTTHTNQPKRDLLTDWLLCSAETWMSPKYPTDVC